MSSLYWIILNLINRIEGQRTAGGIFHLIKGKRSAQTILDAHLFQCSQFVSINKDLNKEAFDVAIRNLRKKELIHSSQGENVVITQKGLVELTNLNKLYILPNGYHGATYEWTGQANQFWNRLSLMVQTLTFLIREKKMFIPVTYRFETQRWVRTMFHNFSFSKEKMSEDLYNELKCLLSSFTDDEAKLFLLRTTTPYRTGKTFEQLSSNYNEDPYYTRIHFHSLLHRCMKIIRENSSDYPFLSHFLQDLEEQKILTETAKETNSLLKQGKTIEEIMIIRGLQQSTIEDHLIELAIYDPTFIFESFISNSELEEVLVVAEKLSTKRLKQIKDELTPQFSYFKIRLAMTKLKEKI